jgi:hypothetical protein
MADPDLVSLKKAIENAGYFAEFHKDPDILYPASIKLENGHTGVSFWIALRKSQWFIATYSPRVYRIPEPERVAELAVAVLAGGGGTPYDFKPEIKETFQLQEVSEDDFDAL